MKKIILFFAMFIFLNGIKAQIAFVNSLTIGSAATALPYPFITKFHVSGYKYVFFDYVSLQIKIFNTNLSVFKTISFPATVGGVSLNNGNFVVELLSEKLFDLDTLMEYELTLYNPPGTPYNAKTYVFKENGTQIFFRDSAMLDNIQPSGINPLRNHEQLHYNGVSPVMRLKKTPWANGFSTTYLYYSLPGSIPCEECSSGITTGLVSRDNPVVTSPVFYPNPVTDQLKLKYELPPDYKNAEIKIYDLQGKLIETFKVTNTFDFIYLPSDYNNGLYLYSLNVDGKVIKTEKIILNK